MNKLNTWEVNMMKKAKQKKRKYEMRKENDRNQLLKQLASGALVLGLGFLTKGKIKK